jgi:hypothetical protein
VSVRNLLSAITTLISVARSFAGKMCATSGCLIVTAVIKMVECFGETCPSKLPRFVLCLQMQRRAPAKLIFSARWREPRELPSRSLHILWNTLYAFLPSVSVLLAAVQWCLVPL